VRAGYGRGYYGEGQLARNAPRRRSWFTVVAVLGAGAAVVWMLWPRSPALQPYGEEPEPPAPPPLSPRQIAASPATNPPAAAEAIGAFQKQLEDDARARGFVLVKDYEDSVVATAKQLQAAGAKVAFEPHLQHLAPRLETP